MICDLAVMTPFFGRTTETAIRRHMLELAPGRTAVLALTAQQDPEREPEFRDRCLILEEGFKYLIKPPTSARELAGIVERATRFMQQHGVKAILSQYLDFSTYFIDLADELQIPFVVHAHGADASQRLRDADWRRRYAALGRATAIAVVSEMQKQALEAIGLDPARIHVIPCGVLIGENPPLPRASAGPLTFVTAGRMTAKKAPILLLDAFRRALPALGAARLDYIGDGPLLSSAYQFVQAMGMESSVTFHGERPHGDVLALIRDADVFVQHCCVDPLTGDSEGLPAAILEAMVEGLPVVSTRHAGIPEAVEEGVTGFLLAEGDTKGMADKFVELGRQPELRRTMGLAGWSRVRERFSWELEKERLLRVLGLVPSSPAPEAALMTRM